MTINEVVDVEKTTDELHEDARACALVESFGRQPATEIETGSSVELLVGCVLRLPLLLNKSHVGIR